MADLMRDLTALSGYAVAMGVDGGMFKIPHHQTGVTLSIVASFGGGWDHVSVSLPNRTPNWAEMEHVKRLFFREDETAMQLHVPTSEHINCHPNCLHLWRPHS